MPVTGTVSFVDPDDIKSLIPHTTLGAANIDLNLVKALVKAPVSVGAAELKFGVATGAELTLRAVNQSKSADPDGVIAMADAKTPSGDLAPQVRLTPEHAWLKYLVAAHAEVTGAGDFGWFGFKAGASTDVSCADYRRHDKDAIAITAIIADIEAKPRFAVSLRDVAALGPGDAVALRVAGELTAHVTLTWSDVFTSQIGTLTRAVNGTVPIGVKVNAGATVTASVKASDAFVLVFSKHDDTHWRIGLKKADVKDVAIGGKAGITVEINNKEEISRILNGVLSDLLGTPLSRVQALLSKTSLNLEDAQQFASVFRRLGLPTIPTIADLQTALNTFEADVKVRLTRIVEEKISLAFAYEYRRVSSDRVLFQALMTRAALEACHQDLARGDLRSVTSPALPSSNQPGEVSIEQYLNEQTVSTKRAFGFTLGVGKWQLAGVDRRELTAVRRLSLDQSHEQRSYIGMGSYTGNVFGEKRTWQVDFSSEMPRFSVGRIPTVNEYEFGLQLSWDETNKKFDANDLFDALDIAVLWSICSARDREAAKQLLQPFLDKNKVDWSAHIRVNDEAFRAILPAVSAGPRTQFAGAMAAAMCAHPGKGGIVDVARRRLMYAPVWNFYLSATQEPSPSEVSSVAINRLRIEEPNAAFAEEHFAQFDRLVTAAGTCALNPRTRANVDDFLRGTRALSNACDRKEEDSAKLTSAYSLMRLLWGQSHHVRALGVRLIDVAAESGVIKGVERTLTVTADGESITLSSNAAGTQ